MRDAVQRDPDHLDRWLLSVMRRRIETVTASVETMKIRKALSVALLDVWNDIRWYLRREEAPRRQTLELVSETWVRLLSPFIPFAAEELNQRMGGKGLITMADWPSTIEFPEDAAAETAELLVNSVLEDARNLLKIIKEPKKSLTLYVASAEAREYFLELRRAQKEHGDRGAVIKKYAGTGIKPERVIKLQYELGEDLVGTLAGLGEFDEFEILSRAAGFISSETGLEVRVFKAGAGDVYDPAKKASGALPFKPAFYLE